MRTHLRSVVEERERENLRFFTILGRAGITGIRAKKDAQKGQNQVKKRPFSSGKRGEGKARGG